MNSVNEIGFVFPLLTLTNGLCIYFEIKTNIGEVALQNMKNHFTYQLKYHETVFVEPTSS